MHLIHRLYSSEFDQAPRSSTPALELMVATIPRSGSTHFGLEAWRTGLLGCPLEYPRALAGGSIYKRFGEPSTGRAFWGKARELRTGANGVFSYKMFVQDYNLIKDKFPDLLSEIAPTHVVRLVREDLAAQAVSYSKAIRSRAWFGGVKPEEIVGYDFNHILECEMSIERQSRYWDRIFALTEVTPLIVSYEQLLRDRKGTFAKIFNYLGIEWDGTFPSCIPDLKVQRDEESSSWRCRYVSERKAWAFSRESEFAA